MSSALEGSVGSDFIKVKYFMKRSSWSAQQCSALFTKIWHLDGVSYVCCLCPVIVSESLFPAVRMTALTFCLLWAMFALCNVSEI